MKLSMEQAGGVLGKSKKTMYNHKDAGKFTVEKDDEGRAVIDVSELMRVYKMTPDITKRIEDLQSGGSVKNQNSTQDYTSQGATKKESVKNSDYEIRIIKLEAELEKEKALKQRAEEDIEYFKEALKKEQDTSKKITLLLENKSQDPNEVWKNQFESLETRIANQITEKEREAEEQLKIVRDKANLEIEEAKEELTKEKNKSWLKKLFG